MLVLRLVSVVVISALLGSWSHEESSWEHDILVWCAVIVLITPHAHASRGKVMPSCLYVCVCVSGEKKLKNTSSRVAKAFKDVLLNEK